MTETFKEKLGGSLKIMYRIFEFKENKQNIRIKSCLKTEIVRTVACEIKSLGLSDEKLWVMLPDSLKGLP